ncbi:MAG: hypothetical protein CVT63_07120 [Candidatus Anoxymicrobium japonicum]|uniref:Uncharacterized protein n=1 Tax=Candidatus Anoxymicrobium japonicum TaxID=2013648 RepID=A0A2N3G4F2_9ACTN|nr:MAG: hypothetical protein CVT63_07120 [Candidatus Anoxymicrobium japonicum]
MPRQNIPLYLIAAIAWTGIFLSAFLIAPRSCEGGLELYLLGSAVLVLVLSSLPFMLLRHKPLSSRLTTASLLGFITVLVWLAGFFIANFRIICRLF